MHCESSARTPPAHASPPSLPGLRLHDSDEEHLHEMSVDARGAITEFIWKIDNVELTTVGIDVGSSTSHLMFARVRLQRKTQHLSSQFVVIGREVLWRSPILLTPFLDDETIDANALSAFVADCYREAQLEPARIDSGAVILTGEAMKKRNAQAIAEIFAADSGKFVCASAGHHLECVLAAHGSGAVALSRQASLSVLNVDIGGGTTKIARIRDGTIVDTCAIAVGGRLVAFDARGSIARIDDSARMAAQRSGMRLERGVEVARDALDRVVDTLADVVIGVIAGERPHGFAEELLLTAPLQVAPKPDVITFSGGVSEYLYGREGRGFGDIAQSLADRILAALESGRIATPVRDPGQGIRATVIGASQFSVQVSGKTIHVAARMALPVHNVPVLAPDLDLGDEVEAMAIADAIRSALDRADFDPDAAVALALRWRGDPHYRRLRALAEGIANALPGAGRHTPLIVIVDGDIGKTLGHILEDEIETPRTIVVVDGIALREFDYVDIGRVIEPANVVPIVIKSLLFAAGQQYLRRRPPPHPSSPTTRAQHES